MKKALFATTTLSLLLASGTAFAQNNQSTGTINFTGAVTTASCTLETVRDVRLGQVSERSLAAAGDASKWEETVIQFRDCNLNADPADLVNAVQLTVASGPAATGNDDLWRNLGDAENVGVEVKIAGVAVTPAGIPDGNDDFKVDIQNTRDPQYHVQGRMVATGKAKAGDVKSVITFVAKYK